MEGARDCFFHNKGPRHVEFMEPGMTINTDSYYDTLLHLHQAMKKETGFLDVKTHPSAR